MAKIILSLNLGLRLQLDQLYQYISWDRIAYTANRQLSDPILWHFWHDIVYFHTFHVDRQKKKNLSTICNGTLK